VATSNNPTGDVADWKVTLVDPLGSLFGVSCLPVGLCVAAGSGKVFTSTDPAGGAAAWTEAKINASINYTGEDGVSCPSSVLCVAVDDSHNVITSRNPTGGPASWTVTHIAGSDAFWGVSCSSASLCVAVDQAGNVVTSTNPTGGASAWKVTNVIGNGLRSVACPSSQLCVAGDDAGNVVTSSDPAGGDSAWAVLGVGDTILGGMSCPSTSLCVAVDYGGNVITSTSPLVPIPAPEPPPVQSPNWKVTKVLGSDCGATLPETSACFTSVSCPSASLCVAGSDRGNVVISVNPTGGAPAWTPVNVDGSNYLTAVACPTTVLCVAADEAGNLLTSTNPTGGAAAWKVTHISGLNKPVAVSCAAGLCAVIDEGGNVLTSSIPTGGASAWKLSHIDTDHLSSVSCPTSHLCVAVDIMGNAISTTNPTGGAAAWKKAHIDGTDCFVGETAAPCFLSGVSCPVINLCVAVDVSGNVVTSTNSTGGAAAWKLVNIGGQDGTNVINGVACPSSTFCIAFASDNEAHGHVLTTNNPTGGAAACRQANSGGDELMGLSCGDAGHCVLVDYWGHVVTSTNPAGA